MQVTQRNLYFKNTYPILYPQNLVISQRHVIIDANRRLPFQTSFPQLQVLPVSRVATARTVSLVLVDLGGCPATRPPTPTMSRQRAECAPTDPLVRFSVFRLVLWSRTQQFKGSAWCGDKPVQPPIRTRGYCRSPHLFCKATELMCVTWYRRVVSYSGALPQAWKHNPQSFWYLIIASSTTAFQELPAPQVHLVRSAARATTDPKDPEDTTDSPAIPASPVSPESWAAAERPALVDSPAETDRAAARAPLARPVPADRPAPPAWAPCPAHPATPVARDSPARREPAASLARQALPDTRAAQATAARPVPMPRTAPARSARPLRQHEQLRHSNRRNRADKEHFFCNPFVL